MPHTLHIVRKDFRLLWPLLAAWWTALVVCSTGGPSFTKSDLAAHLGAFVYMFSWLTIVILLPIIINSLVNADSPASARAQWRTLAVSRGQMLAAKIYFILLFCVWPPILCALHAAIAPSPRPLPLHELQFLRTLDLWGLLIGAGVFAATALLPARSWASWVAGIFLVVGFIGCFGILYWPGELNWEPDLKLIFFAELSICVGTFVAAIFLPPRPWIWLLPGLLLVGGFIYCFNALFLARTLAPDSFQPDIARMLLAMATGLTLVASVKAAVGRRWSGLVNCLFLTLIALATLFLARVLIQPIVYAPYPVPRVALGETQYWLVTAAVLAGGSWMYLRSERLSSALILACGLFATVNFTVW